MQKTGKNGSSSFFFTDLQNRNQRASRWSLLSSFNLSKRISPGTSSQSSGKNREYKATIDPNVNNLKMIVLSCHFQDRNLRNPIDPFQVPAIRGGCEWRSYKNTMYPICHVDLQPSWSWKRIRWEFSSPRPNLCLFSPLMRQSQARVVIVKNSNYFITKKESLSGGQEDHLITILILWSLITTYDKNIKGTYSICWGLRNLASPSWSPSIGVDFRGWRWYLDQTTIFAPLRRIKNATLTCALTGWKSSASPVRCSFAVCRSVHLLEFVFSFYTVVFSDHRQCAASKKYTVYAFMVEAWEFLLSKDTPLMNRRFSLPFPQFLSMFLMLLTMFWRFVQWFKPQIMRLWTSKNRSNNDWDPNWWI